MKEEFLLMIITQASSLSFGFLFQSRLEHPISLKLKPIETSHHQSWTEIFFNNKPLTSQIFPLHVFMPLQHFNDVLKVQC
jgi:hypothetical protein